MKINEAGLALIKSFEKCRLTAYPDPGTGGEPYTIGWGRAYGVHPGETIDQATADRWLLQDLAKTEDVVTRSLLPRVLEEMSPNEFSAMVSFCYNVGAGNFEKSLLLRCVNTNHKADAAAQFHRWVRSDGKVMEGLVTRRDAERALFLTP